MYLDPDTPRTRGPWLGCSHYDIAESGVKHNKSNQITINVYTTYNNRVDRSNIYPSKFFISHKTIV